MQFMMWFVMFAACAGHIAGSLHFTNVGFSSKEIPEFMPSGLGNLPRSESALFQP
jgi:hypothetical protein